MSDISGNRTTAPLKNVMLCQSAIESTLNRAQHLPGMVALYGPSGFGKSTAASYVANSYRAYYVECKSTWTKKALLAAILKEMGISPAGTIYGMTDQVVEQLALSQRPLIVDEMDHIVEKKAVEVIRDLYEGSNASILLIGEERLPTKLKQWERFHGRMLDWIPALPADMEDTKHLARMYCPDLKIATDLLDLVMQRSGHSVRRICVNLDRVLQFASAEGMAEISRSDWGNRELFTGEAPARRLPV